MVRNVFVIPVPHASDKRMVAVALGPLNGFVLRLEGRKHVVSIGLDNIILDMASLGMAFRARFNIDVWHAFLLPSLAHIVECHRLDRFSSGARAPSVRLACSAPGLPATERRFFLGRAWRPNAQTDRHDSSQLLMHHASGGGLTGAYSFCWPWRERTRLLLESLSAVVDFCVNEPDMVTLSANSRFAADQLPVRVAALLALFITAEP
jgi:hypothetical protein